MFGLSTCPGKRRGVTPFAIRATIAGAALVVITAGCSSSNDGGPTRSTSVYAGGTLATSGGAPTVTPSAGTGSATGSTPASTGSAAAGRTPSGGGIKQTVPARTMITKAPVALRAKADFGGRISARISDITPIKAVGQGPGEISGPALRVTFTVTNGSDSTLSLGAVTANLTDSTGAPAVSLTGKPAAPFNGSLAAGKKRSAVYVFSVATSRRAPVTISLNYAADAAVVLFKGNAS